MPHPDITRIPGAHANRSRGVVHGGYVWTLATARDKVQDIGRQTTDCLEQIDAQLRAAGTDKSRLIKVDVYLVDMKRKHEMDEAWTRWVDRDNPPMRMAIETGLAGEDLVEVVCLAALPSG
ncbi:MAG: Rid family hydrolase [Alphaproteobacteria bacterium]